MSNLTFNKFQLICFIVTIMIHCCLVSVTHAAVMKATILDIAGKPVSGVKIFLYESTNVRKPADFISAPSDNAGHVVMTAPSRKYWAVARMKMDSLYGPLMPGDKHSGDPLEIELSDALVSDNVFEVADIRDIGQKKRTGNNDTIKIWGRVLDKDGKPVAGVYVFASKTKEIEFIPEYLSTWTDASGNYVLYVPSIKSLFLGSALQFPPSTASKTVKTFEPTTANLDIATDIQLIVY